MIKGFIKESSLEFFKKMQEENRHVDLSVSTLPQRDTDLEIEIKESDEESA